MNKKIRISIHNKIEEQIRTKHLIPYRVVPSMKYLPNAWYFSDYWVQTFKVLETDYNKYGVIEWVTVKWDDGNYGVICTDLDFNDLKLEKDHAEIYKIPDIVNSEKSFSGAEIVYWFFVNNIDCFNRKYKGFWKFVDRYSAHRISDFSRYKIEGNLINGRYVNCRIIRDK